MRRFGPLLLITALLGAALPVLAVTDPAPPPDDLDHNRRLLDRYRADPDHYARLLRDLRAFETLPPERQERMRQFDRELHEEDPATQQRLWEVLERYSDWVGRLPEADRLRIDEAADRTERLTVVKELREQEWVARLPKAERDDLEAMSPAMRTKRIAVLRLEERQRRKDWRDWAAGVKARPDAGPPRPNRPARAAGLPAVPKQVLSAFARNELTPEERRGLHLGSADETERWEIIKEEYFRRNPQKLSFWRGLDKRKKDSDKP